MEAGSLLPAERRAQILKILEGRGAQSTTALADALGVSIATVRRDLLDLEEGRLLVRSHGGALLASNGIAHEPTFAAKAGRMQAEKERIAARMAAQVPEGSTIIIDAGTTTLAVARRLAGRQLTAITLDLPAAQALAVGATEVLLVGGRVRTSSFSLMGPWAEDRLRHLHADLFIMGAHAVDHDGVSNAVIDEAAVKQAAIKAARETVLVADSSKFGARALVQVCPLSSISVLVTDQKGEALTWLAERIPRVEFA